MRPKLLAVAIAFAFLAVPVQGALAALAGGGCAPCCARAADEAPCERGESPCSFLGAASCCEAAPAAPVPPALRSLDLPADPPVATGALPDLPEAPGLRLGPLSGAREWTALPLRLSVVLQI